MIPIPRRALTLTTATLALVATGTLRSQPLDARTVNLEGTWTPLAHDLHFAFAHRFEIAGEDEGVGDILDDGKVVNYPTFALTYGIAPRISAGARYSTNSLIADRANEWQPFLKVVPVKDAAGVSLSLLGAYNTANESWDGEASAQLDRGPMTLIAAVRGFSSPLAREEEEDDEPELAIGAGGSLALNRYLAVNADYANMVTEDDAQIGWSAGLSAQIPYTPHTLAFYATNVSSGTLEGASVGIDDAVLWGFEFTIPFSGHRWGRLFDPDEESAVSTAHSPTPDTAGSASGPPSAGRDRRGRHQGPQVRRRRNPRSRRDRRALDQQRSARPYGDLDRRFVGLGPDRARQILRADIRPRRTLRVSVHPAPLHEGRGHRGGG